MKGNMKKLVIMVGVAAVVLALAGFPQSVSAQAGGGPYGQSDFVDLDLPDDVAYCGVRKLAEPWTLHVAVTAGIASAQLRIEMQDGTGTTFNIPANDSFSFTQALGGVPGVDNLVRITATQGILEGMANAHARSGAEDPFTEPGPQERDNFCVSIADEGPVSTALAVPNSWVADGDGSNGGTLQ